MVSLARRSMLMSGLLAAACAGVDEQRTGPPGPRVQRVLGGFLSPVVPGAAVLPVPGLPLPMPRPGSGMFVRWQAPVAVALRGQELLVADLGSQRLWRADLATQTLTGVPGAAVGPQTALMLGPDRSAWVLDPPSRQVLRFGLDGRLLQTWRTGAAQPAGMVLLDGGATLAVADAPLAQWIELRIGGAWSQPVLPRHVDGRRLTGVDALAIGRESLFVLDRGARAVHRVARDGSVVESRSTGTEVQPATIAVDRFDRAWVLDAAGRSVARLDAGRPPLVLTAESLGAGPIAGLAVDDQGVALADRLAGQVLLMPLPPVDGGVA